MAWWKLRAWRFVNGNALTSYEHLQNLYTVFPFDSLQFLSIERNVINVRWRISSWRMNNSCYSRERMFIGCWWNCWSCYSWGSLWSWSSWVRIIFWSFCSWSSCYRLSGVGIVFLGPFDRESELWASAPTDCCSESRVPRGVWCLKFLFFGMVCYEIFWSSTMSCGCSTIVSSTGLLVVGCCDGCIT